MLAIAQFVLQGTIVLKELLNPRDALMECTVLKARSILKHVPGAIIVTLPQISKKKYALKITDAR